MSFFTKKNFLYKLIISLCIVLSVMSCSGVKKVYAAEDDGAGVGGLLISPICDLLLGLGDAIMNVIQKSVMNTEATLVLDNADRFDWGALFLGLIVIALAVVLAVVTAGGFVAFLAAITPVLIKAAIIYGALVLVTSGGINTVVSAVSAEFLSTKVVLPTYNIGPEEIFSGRILLFDANVFNPKTVKVDYKNTDTGATGTTTLKQWKDMDKSVLQATSYYYNNQGERIETSVNNSAYELRDIISKWYYIIRSIALIGSMLILLYIGIRIIISSIAEEKAKYKQMLADWVIALCLIFLMHYIMIFAHNIVESITNMFSNSFEEQLQVAVIENPGEKLIEAVEKLEQETGEQYIKDGNVNWPTNQMGRFRVMAQSKDGTVEYAGYTLAYLALVLFTLIFAFTYIKRLLYLLFLTVLAPFVALTYPIDKIHDGKAQAFDMWLKEYIFNLLIQPFHLLLYTIFVTMAFDLAGTNIIYSLVVIGFMVPAEKLLRTMFGFNKASSPGLLAGAGGAALAMSAINSLGKFARGGHGGKGTGGKDQGKEDKGKLRTADSAHSQSSLFESLANGDDSPSNTQSSEPYSVIRGSSNNDNINNDNISNDNGSPSENQENSALENYMNSGYGQNAEGYYFNPWTDEYDEDYDPTKDPAFAGTNKDNIPNTVVAPTEIQQQQSEIITEQISNVDNNAPNNRGKDKNGRSLGRAAGKMLGRAAVSAGKFTLKAGANAAMATTGGMLGLAAGIVSGDAGKAFQNTTMGAGAGMAIASGLSNRTKSVLQSGKGKIDQFERDYYGSEYSQHMREKADKEFINDKAVREMYKQQLNLSKKEDVDKAMKDAVKYREYGINDNNIIIKAMKADRGNVNNRADNRRIAAAKLAENSKTEKDLQTNMQRFAKTRGIKQPQVNDMEKLVRQINNL